MDLGGVLISNVVGVAMSLGKESSACWVVDVGCSEALANSLVLELCCPGGKFSLECSLLGGTPNKSGGSNLTNSSCMDL